MITCYVRCLIDPYKLKRVRGVRPHDRAPACEVRRHAPRSIHSHEGPNNTAVQLFSFPSLAEYERYRTAVRSDETALAAWRLQAETRCVVSFERSFLRPLE
jgi:hypothetical protein